MWVARGGARDLGFWTGQQRAGEGWGRGCEKKNGQIVSVGWTRWLRTLWNWMVLGKFGQQTRLVVACVIDSLRLIDLILWQLTPRAKKETLRALDNLRNQFLSCWLAVVKPIRSWVFTCGLEFVCVHLLAAFCWEWSSFCKNGIHYYLIDKDLKRW